MPDWSPSSSREDKQRASAGSRWRALTARDKRRLLALLLLLPLVHGALACFRLARVRGWLERQSAARIQRPCTAESVADAQRLAELAGIAGRRGAVQASCLRQALVVWWWLRRQGLAPQLRLGTRGTGTEFAAHAWVELEGVALGQGELAHRPFVRY